MNALAHVCTVHRLPWKVNRRRLFYCLVCAYFTLYACCFGVWRLARRQRWLQRRQASASLAMAKRFVSILELDYYVSAARLIRQTRKQLSFGTPRRHAILQYRHFLFCRFVSDLKQRSAQKPRYSSETDFFSFIAIIYGHISIYIYNAYEWIGGGDGMKSFFLSLSFILAHYAAICREQIRRTRPNTGV